MTTNTNTATDTAARIDPERLMRLWATPPADDAAALAELRALYTDPVQINGATMTADDLLQRVRGMQRSYTGLRHELLEQVETPDRLVVVFRLRGTHTGPLATPLGEVAATGSCVRGPRHRRAHARRRPDQPGHDGGRRARPAHVIGRAGPGVSAGPFFRPRRPEHAPPIGRRSGSVRDCRR